ncbi:putative membrane protein [Microbacterium endophyticum]|uniref:Putative membrane protein n=1 Tax=Microbacterium endophyticum TaxID=1526412 RepID=A0A7W4V479_9MICO|nr:TMEM175 family protein [Microbacterium endophyticum]MBB2976515.1 putative membrane protein [Microbacterium endophyticum]NIK35961.1 putative membrane protein [Microbacterium endophyticum]
MIDKRMPQPENLLSSERFKAFTDAVVAIALTLLILPLMESVGDYADKFTTGEWLGEESAKIASFLISFAVIAVFWMGHHRMFAHVAHVDGSLMWLTFAWMLTIVMLPVATAISTAFTADIMQLLVYMGVMTASSVLLFITRIYLLRHPHLRTSDVGFTRRGIAEGAAVPIIFALAMALSIVFPVLSYWTLTLLWLSRYAARLTVRIFAPGTRR